MLLDNPRHEMFAQKVALGMEQGAAYEESGFEARGKSAHESASRLVKDKDVAARITQLRSEAAAKVQMTKEQLLEFLVEVVKTPAGNVTDDHRLCQSYKHTDTERSLKIPDKLRAAELLSKLCDWQAPDRISMDVKVTIGGSQA